MPSNPAAKKLLIIELALRAAAKRLEDTRIGLKLEDTNDTADTVLDEIFEEILEQADQVRMIAQPIIVRGIR